MLTQQNAKLNRRLEKTPAQQSGASDRGQADASGSGSTPQFRAEIVSQVLCIEMM